MFFAMKESPPTRDKILSATAGYSPATPVKASTATLIICGFIMSMSEASAEAIMLKAK